MDPNEERFRRFFLMGLPNRQLEIILGKNLHAKKQTLVDLIIEQEYNYCVEKQRREKSNA